MISMQLCQITLFFFEIIKDLKKWLFGSVHFFHRIWPKVLTLKLPLPQLMVDTILVVFVFNGDLPKTLCVSKVCFIFLHPFLLNHTLPETNIII